METEFYLMSLATFPGGLNNFQGELISPWYPPSYDPDCITGEKARVFDWKHMFNELILLKCYAHFLSRWQCNNHVLPGTSSGAVSRGKHSFTFSIEIIHLTNRFCLNFANKIAVGGTAMFNIFQRCTSLKADSKNFSFYVFGWNKIFD